MVFQIIRNAAFSDIECYQWNCCRIWWCSVSSNITSII